MAVNHELLVEDFKRAEADVQAARLRNEVKKNAFLEGLKESIEKGELKPTDFSFGKLFVGAFGAHEYYACKEGKQAPQELFRRLEESGAGVTTAAFQNISGQIVYSAARVGYEREEYVFAKLVPEDQAIILDGEKIPGITEMGNVMTARKEGDPYKEVGFGEDWIYTPPVLDYGGIVSVTWEAIFNDRTGDVMSRAQQIGMEVGLAEEIQAIDALIDENVTAHRYNWRSGGQIATYGDNSGSHTWDNLAASNALVDWTNINAAEQVLNQIVNPFTGLPVMTDPKQLVVTKQNEQTARRIVSATEIRVTSPGYATSGNPTQTVAANPYLNKYTVLTSRLLAQRLATDTDWFLTDVAQQLLRKVAEPLNSVREPSNSRDDFERRVTARFRANKRFAHVVRQPRVACKNTA